MHELHIAHTHCVCARSMCHASHQKLFWRRERESSEWVQSAKALLHVKVDYIFCIFYFCLRCKTHWLTRDSYFLMRARRHHRCRRGWWQHRVKGINGKYQRTSSTTCLSICANWKILSSLHLLHLRLHLLVSLVHFGVPFRCCCSYAAVCSSAKPTMMMMMWWW